LPRVTNRNVLVGYDKADDAGVYNLTSESGRPLALVQTVDFFTPIVDDPYLFGAIAAANALSDVYAMGGKPISALSILAFSASGDTRDLEQILRGGADKIHESGAVILGGHSISDDQIKFGYSVTGLIDPEQVITNAGARPGDVLVLTKRLGTGVIATALKQGIAEPGAVEAATEQMLTLNRKACEAMCDCAVRACTDVTGFGLLGHAREMALASGVTLRISAGSLRLLPGALAASEAGAHSGGLQNNKAFVESCVLMRDKLSVVLEALLYDPQTSGGLLISVPLGRANQLLELLPDAYTIGDVHPFETKPIEVIA
jgi:selenide,water dikinase